MAADHTAGDGPAGARPGHTAVFVAGPFLELIDPATGRMPDDQRARFERLIDHLTASGFTVFNAHKREKWGAAFLRPDQFTRLDYEEIAASDVVVAVPGPPPSPGTHIELGWASALGKPIVLLLERGEDHALMLYGLRHVVPTEIVETAGGRFEPPALDQALASALAAAAGCG